MHARAERLIHDLGLTPHPEGGWYREVFRSDRAVRSEATLSPRSALTTIYFLLVADRASRWHRVVGDEAWHFYEGDPVELLWFAPGAEAIERRMLAPVGDGGHEPVVVVPAGRWQAARTTGSYSLVGCAMGPGFDYADFALLADRPEEAERVRALHPEHAHLI